MRSRVELESEVARLSNNVAVLRKAVKVRVPRKAIERVLAMAEEMSGENSYQAWDEEEQVPIGVAPKVKRDLDAVRKFLKDTRTR